ncbi:hypothetical protein [Aminobacter sp. MET-1]|uniref:hypothetical protein n=1 Tax=Aminobacter sp. MET-1 TaxID=2951085 RepID=UPI00226985CC|nr:hypothetical protein [Aminobacter sp. MET-1]MCX8571082.1 hypothetical protein [Aminobacter sp. MET-1]MCX8573249.1 hypothetical protein [Aminobacter sp. MET-1]
MVEPETGLVISYYFLWARQHDKGEVAGRKPRPACIVVPLNSKHGDVVLFPLTRQLPTSDRLAIKVPETERRRLKLKGDQPCWILLDEGNTDRLSSSFHVEPIDYDPLVVSFGRFSRAFMRQVLIKLADALRQRKLRLVNRL